MILFFMVVISINVFLSRSKNNNWYCCVTWFEKIISTSNKHQDYFKSTAENNADHFNFKSTWMKFWKHHSTCCVVKSLSINGYKERLLFSSYMEMKHDNLELQSFQKIVFNCFCKTVENMKYFIFAAYV